MIAADGDRLEPGAAGATALEKLSTQKTQTTPAKPRALRNHGGRGECRKLKNNWVNRMGRNTRISLGFAAPSDMHRIFGNFLRLTAPRLKTPRAIPMLA